MYKENIQGETRLVSLTHFHVPATCLPNDAEKNYFARTPQYTAHRQHTKRQHQLPLAEQVYGTHNMC